MYNNLHFSIHNFKANEFRVSINYLRCRLVEGVKIFPVCVRDQLMITLVYFSMVIL